MTKIRNCLLLAMIFILKASCSTRPQRQCTGLDGGKKLADECCDASGGLRPELIAYSSRCAAESTPLEVQTLLAKCGPQAPPGGGAVSENVHGFAQALQSLETNLNQINLLKSEKDGVGKDDKDAAMTDKDGKFGPPPGSKLPPPLNPNSLSPNARAPMGGGSVGGPGGNVAGGGGAILGGGGTAPSKSANSMLDPNAQLGSVVSSEYSGGGGSGGARSKGGSSASGGLAGLMGSLGGLFGQGGAGGEKTNGNGITRFGTQPGAPGGAAAGSADPEDYFTRIDPNASLFEIVEKRYQQSVLTGKVLPQ